MRCACFREPNSSLEKVVEYDHLLGRLFPSLRSKKTGGHKVARFRQVNMDAVGVHHDALEFPNGKTVLVASLLPGQHATVLQLPAMPYNASQVERPGSRTRQMIRRRLIPRLPVR